jgi:hypothetical protein
MSALASDLASKRVELLKELCPQAKRVAVLWDPGNQSKVTEWKDTQLAAQSAALTLVPFDVQTSAEIDRALPSIKREQPDATRSLCRRHGGWRLTTAITASKILFRSRNKSPSQCPLSGVKRTLCGRAAMSAFDPKRTPDACVTRLDPFRMSPPELGEAGRRGGRKSVGHRTQYCRDR